MEIVVRASFCGRIACAKSYFIDMQNTEFNFPLLLLRLFNVAERLLTIRIRNFLPPLIERRKNFSHRLDKWGNKGYIIPIPVQVSFIQPKERINERRL